WTRAAIDGEYAFTDSEWTRWLAAQLEAGQRGEWLPGRATAPVSVAAPTAAKVLVTANADAAASGESGAPGASVPAREEASDAHTFADDLWGRALAQFVAAAPEHGRVYEAWLATTALDAVTDTEVTVVASSSFQAEWITRKYLDPLSAYLSAVAGRPLGLTVRPSDGSEASAESSQADLFTPPA
ncbi:MAG: hypothetical protein MUE41_00355, partial [Gemmatimonadaceae bacterium]|nr:hypothetical protein [Gemmatimonadaceae bacterium]